MSTVMNCPAISLNLYLSYTNMSKKARARLREQAQRISQPGTSVIIVPGDLVGVALQPVCVLEWVCAVAGERLRVGLPRRVDDGRLAQQLRHRQEVAVHGDLQRRKPLLQIKKGF